MDQRGAFKTLNGDVDAPFGERNFCFEMKCGDTEKLCGARSTAGQNEASGIVAKACFTKVCE